MNHSKFIWTNGGPGGKVERIGSKIGNVRVRSIKSRVGGGGRASGVGGGGKAISLANGIGPGG